MNLRPVAWAAILGIVLAICGTAVAVTGFATHTVTVTDVQNAGGGLLVGIITLVVCALIFE